MPVPQIDTSGDWRGLDNAVQGTRYEALVRLLHLHALDANILDVGCGEAILTRYLPATWRGSYTGVERNGSAAAGATLRSPRDRLVRTRLEDFQSSDRYQAIVFNEVLYYLADPLGALERCERLLAAGGVFVISIYQKPGRVRLTRRLLTRLRAPRSSYSNIHCTQMVEDYARRKGYAVLDRRDVRNPSTGAIWRMNVVQPQARS